jgi:hypothetical protein
MTNQVNAAVGCHLIGEYVDEAECPTDLACRGSEVVRPQIVASYLDLWGRDDGLREFTVLLKDGPIVAVRGHGLKHEPNPQGGADIYGIVVRTGGEEVLVALFKSHDVSGIFCGEIRSDRKIA